MSSWRNARRPRSRFVRARRGIARLRPGRRGFTRLPRGCRKPRASTPSRAPSSSRPRSSSVPARESLKLLETRQRRVRAGIVCDRRAREPEAGLCRLARRLAGEVLALGVSCRRQRICIGSGAAAPRQRRTARCARIPLQRSREFRRRLSSAAHLGRTALHAGPRSGAPLRAGRARALGSGGSQQAEGRVRVDRLPRAPHAVERDSRMGVDAAHGVRR